MTSGQQAGKPLSLLRQEERDAGDRAASVEVGEKWWAWQRVADEDRHSFTHNLSFGGPPLNRW